MKQDQLEMTTICAECGEELPCDDVGLHIDWRKADRPHIDYYIPKSPMCFRCWRIIHAAFSPTAPRFDKFGDRITKSEEDVQKSTEEMREYLGDLAGYETLESLRDRYALPTPYIFDNRPKRV